MTNHIIFCKPAWILIGDTKFSLDNGLYIHKEKLIFQMNVLFDGFFDNLYKKDVVFKIIGFRGNDVFCLESCRLYASVLFKDDKKVKLKLQGGFINMGQKFNQRNKMEMELWD